jgi:hypothetical protein
MDSVHDGQVAQIQLWPCGYRAKCTAPDCPDLARVIIRRVEAGGAPMGQDEYCNKHARVAAEAALASGIAVHDMRSLSP